MAASTDSVRRWERVTVSETLRMKLNGESEAQMVHARAIKAAGGVSLAGNFGPGIPESKRCDTSIDQDWPIDASACARRSDFYVVITTGVWLGVKIPIFAVPMLVSHVLPMLVVRLYMSVLPDGTDRVSRSCAFYALYALALVLAVPAIVLIFLSYVLDCIAYYSFSLFFCTCTWRWLRAMDSFEKIRPYREGPSFADHLPDLFVALVGQTSRQTVFETTYMLACMWLLIPWLKYYVNCNPWIYDLNHRLCQQISTEMADLGGADSVADRARYLISCAREDRGTAERLDIWSFVPHYPLPPPDRRWALGLQAGGAAYPGKFTLIVHTTHAIQSVRDVTEQFVLSNCCEQPIYRVMLWYNNPYHFLTGWVEASVSNGQPSQLNKAFGGEHPMWLVTARSPLVAGRDSWTGSGMIDAFFDYWLPVFVHEMRRQVLGREAADRKYQQVSSKDGISPPEALVGLEAYREAGITTAIDDYAEQAAKQRKDLAQPIGTQVARLAETRLGLWAARQLQRKDLHSVGRRYEGWSSPTHAACARSFNAECQGLGAQGDASGMQPESAACKRRREPADSSDEMQLSQVPLRRRRTGEASSQ
eukprot:CAMPEP_0179124908 /NCGR_PEP_ID=MMETSP0796-20121207/59049_1 /TAXON_ID=73915 /ORGANISM="Pyrodinium bahamense, Strain pbaha01" /LENGTH=590 /DNA_ID=CAMNT_0020823587 /DNA_START=47 /DNA_END=1819 /DNA_ORIENTATION=+